MPTFASKRQKSPASEHAESSGPRNADVFVRRRAFASESASNQERQRLLADRPVQRKLTVNRPGEKFEREADRVSEAVVAMSGNDVWAEHQVDDARPVSVQRMCSRCRRRYRQGRPLNCSDCEEELHRKATSPRTSGEDRDLEQQIASVRRGGRRLSASARSFFEPRFGRDFSDVRVHTGSRADAAAQSVNAEAFTVGRDIAFRSGAYRPGTDAGKQLLAHELTHVVQQRGSNGRHVQRQVGPAGGQIDPMDSPRMHPEDSEEQEKSKVDAQTSSKCDIPSNCPDHFCTPYDKVSYARHMRTKMMPTLLAGIAGVVSPRVVPVWHNYLLGGDSKQDFSDRFASDFAGSQTTEYWTRLMKSKIQTALAGTVSSVGAGVVYDISFLIPSFIDRLGKPGNGMNFNIPGEIPGNLAGGIGDDQKQCKVGAKPSNVDDDRTAQGTVELTQASPGDLEVTPSITYTVTDTVDLCPGNCGAGPEQIATVPMSQFEATGISGDVPYEITFPAPMDSFTISTSGSSSGGSSGGGSSGGAGSATSGG